MASTVKMSLQNLLAADEMKRSMPGIFRILHLVNFMLCFVAIFKLLIKNFNCDLLEKSGRFSKILFNGLT